MPKHNFNKDHCQDAKASDRRRANLTKAGFGFQQAWGALQHHNVTWCLQCQSDCAAAFLLISSGAACPGSAMGQGPAVCGSHRAPQLTLWSLTPITGVADAVAKHQGLLLLWQKWEWGKPQQESFGNMISLPLIKWCSYLSLWDRGNLF